MNTPTPKPLSKQRKHDEKMRAEGYVRFNTWIRPQDKVAVQAFIAELERRHAKGAN